MATRPTSGQSRNAWGVSNYNGDGIRDDPDLCSDDQFGIGDDRSRSAAGQSSMVKVSKPSSGGNVFVKIGRGIRGM